MKIATLISITFLLSVFNTAKCQVNNSNNTSIQEFTFDAVKDYDNNVRIAYFTIVGLENNVEGQFIQTELRENNAISRFYVYAIKDEKSKCMIETLSTMNEAALLLLINNAINHYRETTLQDE